MTRGRRLGLFLVGGPDSSSSKASKRREKVVQLVLLWKKGFITAFREILAASRETVDDHDIDLGADVSVPSANERVTSKRHPRHTHATSLK
jgi:hypothetical protein